MLPGRVERRRYFRWFFFGFLLFLLYQLTLILSLFFSVIVWASSLSLVFWPVHRRVQKRFRKRRSVAAVLTTSGVVGLVVIPLTALFYVVLLQSAELYPTLENWLERLALTSREGFDTMLPPFMQETWAGFQSWRAGVPFLADVDVQGFLLQNIDALSLQLADFGTSAARNLVLGLINFILVIVLMYFCFRDGERFMEWFFDVIPMESRHAQDIAGRAYQTVRAVINGALVTASMQGLLALVGYWIAGVPLALLFGVLTGFAALIPVVGAGLVWFPLGIIVFMDNPGWGLFLMGWGFFLVSLIDNLLKPFLIGSQTRMPILLIFCAMIGGANVYGVSGFLIGPILVAVLMACITIYREYYLSGQDQLDLEFSSGSKQEPAS